MISECLRDINDKTELDSFYNQESPNTLPPLLICRDKLVKQNNEVEMYMLNRNNIQNQTTSGSELYAGYAKNIDIDSELRRINHIRDKCYNDNYKISHQEAPFLQHAKLYEKQTNLLNNIKNKSTNALNRNLSNQQNCIPKEDRTDFDKCQNPPIPSNNDTYINSQPVYYSFNNQEFCREFPCQKLFHNITRRSTLPAGNTHHDVNPEFLSCCNQDF